MRFGQIDATEAQVTMMAIMLITAMAGTGFWGIKVSNRMILYEWLHQNLNRALITHLL